MDHTFGHPLQAHDDAAERLGTDRCPCGGTITWTQAGTPTRAPNWRTGECAQCGLAAREEEHYGEMTRVT